ncbi:uncharacterized protein LOC143464850 isoform X5 [Clavelina lepadiformis]|uniref:uncharacterized protein LOC143464850 isoform X5 n=1 Tax=Clavelina lepadiformis TaxID=159417 RepID=UPI00404142CA
MKPIFKQKFSVPTSSPRLSPILSQSKENGTSRAKTCDKSSNKENGLSQNNTDDATSKIEQSLSDEQYDEIFSTVLRKAAEGKLFDEKNPECLSPHRAAEQYKQFVQKLSPKRCSAPEIDWTAALKCSQDHFVYTKFNAGSIVWAKMPGYPSWPAMIDSDPDMNLFYEYNDDGTVLRYHVVFLDDHVSRAWIPACNIVPYKQNTSRNFVDSKGRDFKAELQSAMLNADAALKMTLEQRLGKFSFEKRFISNKIGMKEWFAERSSRKAKSHGSSKRIKTNISARVTPHSDVESKGKNSTIATGNRLCHEGGSLAERAEIVKEKTANKENSNVKPDKTSQETIHKRSPKTARMSSPSTKLAVSILKKLETSNQKRVDFATKVILENVHETELIDVTNVVKNKDAGDCCITNIKETNLSSQDFNDPLKGDLKSSTAEESPGRAIQNLTKHKLDIDECFWDPCPDDFQDSPSVFCNLDEPSMAMNDSDEERMRQLDELMPVLVQQD